MAFEHKPGSFSLFKNEKTSDTQPDYKGDGADLEGNLIEVAAWLKEGKNGKYMSCKLQPKRIAKHTDQKSSNSAKRAQEEFIGDTDSDIPF